MAPFKTIIRPDIIKGIFPLLAAFLTVVEVLLGYWLSMAENMNERVIVGIIMTVIFMGFLIIALKVKQTDARGSITDERIEGDDPKIVSEIISIRDKQISELEKNLKKSEDELGKLKPEYDRLKRLVDNAIPLLSPEAKLELVDKGFLR